MPLVMVLTVLVTAVLIVLCCYCRSDLVLLLNFIKSSYSLRSGETWTPVCFPRFRSDGMLHAFVSCACVVKHVVRFVDNDTVADVTARTPTAFETTTVSSSLSPTATPVVREPQADASVTSSRSSSTTGSETPASGGPPPQLSTTSKSTPAVDDTTSSSVSASGSGSADGSRSSAAAVVDGSGTGGSGAGAGTGAGVAGATATAGVVGGATPGSDTMTALERLRLWRETGMDDGVTPMLDGGAGTSALATPAGGGASTAASSAGVSVKTAGLGTKADVADVEETVTRAGVFLVLVSATTTQEHLDLLASTKERITSSVKAQGLFHRVAKAMTSVRPCAGAAVVLSSPPPSPVLCSGFAPCRAG